MTEWGSLRELLFIVKWLWAGLLLDYNSHTRAKVSSNQRLVAICSWVLVFFMSIASDPTNVLSTIYSPRSD